MKEKLTKAVTSRTVWTVAIIFAIAGFESIQAYLPEDLVTPILAMLGLAATYFKVNPSQSY